MRFYGVLQAGAVRLSSSTVRRARMPGGANIRACRPV